MKHIHILKWQKRCQVYSVIKKYIKSIDPDETRTRNLLIRSQTPYPLGHEAGYLSVFFCVDILLYRMGIRRIKK